MGWGGTGGGRGHSVQLGGGGGGRLRGGGGTTRGLRQRGSERMVKGAFGKHRILPMALAGQYSIEERDQHVAVGRDVFHTTIQFEARSVLT